MASKFQQRHYEAIAEVIQEALHIGPKDQRLELGFNEGVGRVVTELQRLFEKDNPLFMHDRWLRACVPGANVKARS